MELCISITCLSGQSVTRVHSHAHDEWVDIFDFLAKNFNCALCDFGIKGKIFIYLWSSSGIFQCYLNSSTDLLSFWPLTLGRFVQVLAQPRVSHLTTPPSVLTLSHSLIRANIFHLFKYFSSFYPPRRRNSDGGDENCFNMRFAE